MLTQDGSPLTQPATAWAGPGKVDSAGNICTSEPGMVLKYGTIWVELAQADIAEQFGWVRDETTRANVYGIEVVQVTRDRTRAR